MTKLFIPLWFIVFLMSSCEKHEFPGDCSSNNEGGSTEWFNELIKNHKNSPTPVKVYQGIYMNQAVVGVSICSGCPDGGMTVYDCYKNVVCEFGGIAGQNTCPDFQDQVVNWKLYWEN